MSLVMQCGVVLCMLCSPFLFSVHFDVKLGALDALLSLA